MDIANTTPAAFGEALKNTLGSTAQADQKSIPEDNADGKTADEQKPVTEEKKSDPPEQEDPEKKEPENKEEKPLEEKEPEDSGKNEQKHDWKKRFDEQNKTSKETSEAYQRTIDTNARVVENHPEMLAEIADVDPALADQIAKKLYNAESYKSHTETEALNKIKEEDPERYENEKELSVLRAKEQVRKDKEKKEFYASKDITVNQFDEKYQKVEAELKKLNPAYVEEDPKGAYDLAHRLAFPTKEVTPEEAKQEKNKEHLAKQTNNSKGGNVNQSWDDSPTGKREMGTGAKAFNNQFTSLTKKS